MSFDDKGTRLHGRLEFFDRNVTQLTKHLAQIIGHHQGKRYFDMSGEGSVQWTCTHTHM